MVYIYLITIRKHQVLDYVTYDDLRICVVALKLRLPYLHVICSGYEVHGLYRQLHVHLVCYNKGSINYRSINNYFKNCGFIIHFTRCFVNDHEDMNRIVSYVCKYDKNEYDRDVILIENYYRYHYGF